MISIVLAPAALTIKRSVTAKILFEKPQPIPVETQRDSST